MRKSKQISVMFPPAIVEKLDKFLSTSAQRDFIRKAVAEKLNRDFGASLSRSEFLITQGKRTDLDTPEKRAAKLPALREQARRARESKRKE